MFRGWVRNCSYRAMMYVDLLNPDHLINSDKLAVSSHSLFQTVILAAIPTCLLGKGINLVKNSCHILWEKFVSSPLQIA